MKTKKHPCPDCQMCQWCSDDRCRLCLQTGSCRKKLSMAEQIALFEQGNRCTSSTSNTSGKCQAACNPTEETGSRT